MRKLYLVDVSSMFFRAYFAIPNLTNKEGFPTNALYGFLNMTAKLLNDHKPDHMVYCFDRVEPTFRKDLDERYKANRSEMPEDLQVQVPYIKEITDLLGIPRLDMKGYEADDIIGSYAHWGTNNDYEVVIVSSDKDFAQLINEKTTMLDTMKSVSYDIKGVEKKWGIHPDQFIDYLALIGDSSDNIPGVRGVGPKTAQKLIGEHNDLDSIYKAIDTIKGSVHKKLNENKDEAYLSKKLVTICTDLEVPTDEFLNLKEKNIERLEELFAKFNFKTIAKQLLDVNLEEVQAKSSKDVPKYEFFQEASVKDLEKIPEKSAVYFFEEHPNYYLVNDTKVYSFEKVNDEIKKLLVSKQLKWSGFDLKTLWKEIGIEFAEFKDDLMLAGYALNAGNIDFANLHQTYLGPAVPDAQSPSALVYAHTHMLETIKNKMPKKVKSVYENIEKPLMPILLKMENLGVKVDADILKQQSEDLNTDIKSLEKEIHDLAGEDFNINSPKQLGEILFNKLKVPSSKKTKTGFSTATDVLEKLEEDWPIASKVLKYREYAKLKSTYVDALPKLIHSENGRVHTSFRQALTTTGRLSSVSPNLQNIPIRTEKGILIRKAFIPTPGWDLIAADYSQIELRVLAHIAEDSALIDAYQNNKDIHAVTASEVFGVDLNEVDRNQRRIAKAVNFGIAYGQGVYGLAETLKIPRSEAKDIIETYFNKFSGIKTYMDEIVRVARDQGYVESLFGRRRYLPELKSKNRAQQAFGQRAAINAPMQGTASDLVKMAMIEVHREIDAPMILQVHDELIFECEKSESEKQMLKLKKIMEEVTQLKVPLVVNCAKGANWLEAH